MRPILVLDQKEILAKFTKFYKKVRNYDVSIYNREGKTDRTIILVHGWLGDASGLSLVADAISEKFNIYLLDLPGHGDSGQFNYGKHSCDLDMSLFLEAVQAVVEVSNSKPWLVGHSMGGAVIQEYITKNPEKTQGAILVSTAADFRNIIPEHIEEFMIKEIVEVKFVARLLSDFFLDRAFRDLHDPEDKLIKKTMQEQLLSTTLEAAICPFKYIISKWSMRGREIQYNKPVLIVVGKSDIVTPKEKAEELREMYPSSNMVELENATHLLPLTHHHELASIIDTFIDENS